MDSLIDMKALLEGMDIFTVSLWLTGAMLVLVIIGVRVAFATAFIGFLGPVPVLHAKAGVRQRTDHGDEN